MDKDEMGRRNNYAIDCPIGAFFGNELGLHDIRILPRMTVKR